MFNLAMYYQNISYPWALLGVLSPFESPGVLFVIMWDSLSTRPAVHRLPITLLALALTTSTMIVIYPYHLLLLNSLALISLWGILRCWKIFFGWRLHNIYQGNRSQLGNRFSIKDLIIWTTVTALLMMWFQVLISLDAMPGFSTPTHSLTTMVVQSLQMAIYAAPFQGLVIITLMDKQRTFVRGLVLFFLITFLIGLIPVFFGMYDLLFLMILYGSQLICFVFMLLAGLALRWAGYRIVKEPHIAAIAE